MPRRTKIFISYRREDGAAEAGRIYDRLERRVGKRGLFLDVDSLANGGDFREELKKALDESAVLVVVMGPRWLDLTDETGRRRLDNSADFVRLEVERGLASGIRVIPVLLDGARLPRVEDLPEGMRDLVFRNARHLRTASWPSDIRALEEAALARPSGGPWPARLGLGLAAAALAAGLWAFAPAGFWVYGRALVAWMVSDATETVPPPATPPSRAAQVWAENRASREPVVFEAFLASFPDAPEAAAARAELAALRAELRQGQVELQRLGLYDGESDGVWGGGSSTALRRFETASGRFEDGVLQREDLAALRAAPTPGPPTEPSPLDGKPVVLTDDPASLAPGTVFRECAACPEMVALPGGTYTMGSRSSEPDRSDREGPQQQVTISPFAMGRTEVTFALWDACAADGYCTSNWRPDDDRGWGRGDRPVINVSWNDITGERGFLAWLNSRPGVRGAPYRLPSEAEWEYAARAGTETAYSFGADAARLREYGWYSANSGRTQPVGGKPANPFGLHDMHGNVWEWVQDCWNGSLDATLRSGAARMTGDCSRSVLRGGSWDFNGDGLRSAYRLRIYREDLGDSIGFRVARSHGTP